MNIILGNSSGQKMKSEKNSIPKKELNYYMRLTIITCAVLLLFKLWFLIASQNQMRSLYLISFIQDACLLYTNYFICIFLYSKLDKTQRIGRILFYIIYTSIASVSFVYTFFLFDLMSFPINIFALTMENISFFMEYFMNVELLLGILIGGGLLFSISIYFPKKLFWSKLPVIAAIITTILFVPTILRPSINPFVYSLQEQITLSFSANSYLNKLQSPTANSELKEKFRFLDKSSEENLQLNSKYKRVIVLVMEGINYNDFYEKSSTDGNSFINQQKKNIITYNSYYTLNLDSYTSLIAMLNNVFIPYQAYVDERKYNFVNNGNNLVRLFNSNGFTTHFLTSYGEQQKRFVPNYKEWTKVITIDNLENNDEFACLTSSKIETACEDLAVFYDLIQILKNNPQPFIFQEMVYGHSAEWFEKTGIKTIDYYNQYFNKLIEALKSNNLLDKTLLIITSDHGPRDNAYDKENYHIPMFIWANDLSSDINENLTSHLDFMDILLELITGEQYVQENESIITLGNSGELIYGKITSEGKYIFINNRMLNLKSNVDEETIKKFNSSF